MICLIRKIPVLLTPEEKVRQALLYHMINHKGFPPGLIAVEYPLSKHFFSEEKKPPSRRADILVFSGKTDIKPLLLVECKAINLSKTSERQIIGYNLFIKAPFIVLANQKEIKTGIYEKGIWSFFSGIPDYQECLSILPTKFFNDSLQ